MSAANVSQFAQHGKQNIHFVSRAFARPRNIMSNNVSSFARALSFRHVSSQPAKKNRGTSLLPKGDSEKIDSDILIHILYNSPGDCLDEWTTKPRVLANNSIISHVKNTKFLNRSDGDPVKVVYTSFN